MKLRLLRKIIYSAGRRRAASVVQKIEPFLHKSDQIVDIGAGTCNISELLREKNFSVTPVDVQNLSYIDSINPIIYDGDRLSFADNSFDAALLLTCCITQLARKIS